MDLALLLSLYAAHKWLLIAALVIGFSVRQIKPDAAFPVDIAPRYRPLVALALGGVATASDMLLRGDSLKQAAFIGLGGAAIAILGHVFGVEVVLGGKELPPLGRKGPKPPSKPGDGMMGGKPPSGGAPPSPPVLPIFALALFVSACGLLRPSSPLDFAKAACVAANAFLDVKALRAACDGLEGVTDADLEKLMAANRAGAQKAGAAACKDAGAE